MDKIKAILILLKDFVKAHLKLILSLLGILAVIIIAYNVIVGSPKRPVKNFIKAIDSGDLSKIEKYIDTKGFYVFYDACEFNYKDFDKEYKKFKKTDDYEDFLDFVDELIKESEEELDDNNVSVSIDKIVSVDKVSKKLYKVKAKLDVDTKYDKGENWTVTFYVMKSGWSYKVVGVDEKTFEDIY